MKWTLDLGRVEIFEYNLIQVTRYDDRMVIETPFHVNMYPSEFGNVYKTQLA